jgi:hypothetical protein
MLENLKVGGAYMQESKELGNQQANRDLGWLAGILDGEGSIILGTQIRKNGDKQYYHRICFYNSDDELVNKVVKILDANDIKSYVAEREFYNELSKKKGFTVSVSNYESAVKLLNLVKDDLVCKKARAELLLRFCVLRSNRINKSPNEEEKEIISQWDNELKTKHK